MNFWMKRYYGLFTCNFFWKQQFQIKIILMIDLTNTQLFTLHNVKGRVGDFEKASNSNLALKLSLQITLQSHASSKTHEHVQVDQRGNERWRWWRVECNAVRLLHISFTSKKTLQYKVHNTTIISPSILCLQWRNRTGWAHVCANRPTDQRMDR